MTLFRAGNSNGRSTFRNADKTLREGVEFAWNKKLWRDLIATASYSYLEATFDADIPALGNIAQISSGNAIPGIAKNRLCLFGMAAIARSIWWCRCTVYGQSIRE